MSKTSGEKKSDEIKIAILQSREEKGTYFYGNWAIQGFKLGLQYATESENYEGPYKVNDQKIKLKIYNTEESPEKAVKKAKDAINNWGADFLFGGTLSSVAIPLQWIAEEYKTPYFICPAASPRLTQEPRFNRYIFRIGRNSWHELNATAYHYTVEKGFEDIGLVAIDNDFGISLVEMAEKAFGKRGAEIVERQWVPPHTEDFSPYIEKIKKANPDGLFLAWAGDFVPLLKEVEKNKLIDKILGGIFDLFTMNRINFSIEKLEHFYEGVEGFCYFGYDVNYGPQYDWILETMKEENIRPDDFVSIYSQKDGDWADRLSKAKVPEVYYGSSFATAQFMVEGFKRNPDLIIENLISTWEGMVLYTPIGETKIRPEDHQGLRSMNIGKAVIDEREDSDTNGLVIGERVQEIPRNEVDPPIKTDYRPSGS